MDQGGQKNTPQSLYSLPPHTQSNSPALEEAPASVLMVGGTQCKSEGWSWRALFNLDSRACFLEGGSQDRCMEIKLKVDLGELAGEWGSWIPLLSVQGSHRAQTK